MCRGQVGGEKGAAAAAGEVGEEAGWDSLTGCGEFRVKLISEPCPSLRDWGPLVAQGDGTGFQGIRLRFAEWVCRAVVVVIPACDAQC